MPERPGEHPGERLSPTPAEAARHVERLADRLRVWGPRLAARSGTEARELLTAVRAGLQALADLTADEEGEPRRTVPELAPHALGDQVLVLGYDLLGRGDPGARSDSFRVRAVDAVDAIYRLV